MTHSAENDVPECNCDSMGGRFGAHRPECPWQVAFEAQLAAEKDAPCLGDGGVIFWHDGYGLLGGQWIETPCEACGGWHDRRPIPPAEKGQADA